MSYFIVVFNIIVSLITFNILRTEWSPMWSGVCNHTSGLKKSDQQDIIFYATFFNGVVYSLKDEYYFVLFQLLDVAATDLLNKSSGSPATTPLHLVVSFLCHSFIFEILCDYPSIYSSMWIRR